MENIDLFWICYMIIAWGFAIYFTVVWWVRSERRNKEMEEFYKNSSYFKEVN